MWRGLRISGYKKMSKKPNRGNELGNLFSFAEEYLIDPSLIPVNKGMRLGGLTKFTDLYETVCSSLNLISLCAHRNGMRQRSLGRNTPADKSQLQVALCVWENFFVKVSVSETEFCRHKKSHKIKSDWISATRCGDKTLLLRQKFSRTRKLLQQLIARPVHTEPRPVAATSRLVCYALIGYENSLITRYWFHALENEATSP